MLANLTLLTGLFALLFVAISFNINRLRWKYQVAFGDAGQDALHRAVRAHGNFTEFVPFALGLIWLNVWLQATSAATATAIAAFFFAGRLIHAYGLLIAEPRGNRLLPRMLGTIATYTTLAVSGLILLVHACQ